MTFSMNLMAGAIALDLVIALALTLIVLARSRRNHSVTLAWILSFFFLPYFGAFFYSIVGYRERKRRKRIRPMIEFKRSKSWREKGFESKPTQESLLPPEIRKIAELVEGLTQFPATSGNRLQFFEDAYATYGAIAEAILGAQHHIHVEYYIFQPDETGLYFRDLLCKKAKEGVQCRLLVDHIGSFQLGRKFFAPLKEAGVEFAFFAPVRILRPWGWHLRNHRKLVVVDGVTGFIGSQNIGNEYLQWKAWARIRSKDRLSWKDAQLKIQGPAIRQLQSIFLEDWRFATLKELGGREYFPVLAPQGASLVQALPTGPDEREYALEMILTQLIYAAEKRILITTPYLIPTLNTILALEAAVQRGVQVDLLIPEKSDSWAIDQVSRCWFREFLRIGARMHAYGKSFLHSKTITIDHSVALLGSANMDERSFKINFECSVLVYDADAVSQLALSAEAMIQKSEPITLDILGAPSFLTRALEGGTRLLSPLL